MNAQRQSRRIGFWTLTSVALRTFFLQTAWNFQRMQNLGFAFAVEPVIRKVQPALADQAKSIKRHLEFFVTHPYCASLILGVVARLEEESADSGGESMDANQIKVGMMGPLAALGDTLFWATLKPALALVGVSLVLLTPPGEMWPAAAGPIVFLALYSAAHLGLRLGGVFAGYRRGLDIIKDLRRINPQGIAQRIGLFTAVVGGATAAGFFQIRQPVRLGSRLSDTLALGALSTLLVFGLRRGLSASRMFYLLVALALLGGYLGLG